MNEYIVKRLSRFSDGLQILQENNDIHLLHITK